MTHRYYEAEHVAAYARLRSEGLNSWNDLHTGGQAQAYEDFQGRDFLNRVLPMGEEARGRRLLEYGCGTGAAACFMAERGFAVDAVDLVPDAIAVARRFAAERGVTIRFAVQDICLWADADDRFEYVVDIFCLQSIVTDDDRRNVLAGVHQRLEPGGRYVITCAMYDPERFYGDEDRYDPSTGIVWTALPGHVDDAVQFDGSWFVPNRRHLTSDALRDELEGNGYRVLEQSGRLGGEVVCMRTL